MIAYVILGVCLIVVIFIMLLYLLKHPRKISGSDFGVAPWRVRYKETSDATCLSFKHRAIFCCHNSSGKIYLYYLDKNNNTDDYTFLNTCEFGKLKPELAVDDDNVRSAVFNDENTEFYKDVKELAADTLPNINYVFRNNFLFLNVVDTIKHAFEDYEGLCYDWDDNRIDELYMSPTNKHNGDPCWPVDDSAPRVPEKLPYKTVSKPPPIRWEDWGRMMLTFIADEYLTTNYKFCSDDLLNKFIDIYVCSNQLYHIHREPQTMLFTWTDTSQEESPTNTPVYQHDNRFTNNHELHDLFTYNAINNTPCLISYTQTKASQPKQYQHLFDYFSNYLPLLVCQKRMLEEFITNPPSSNPSYFHLSFMYTALNKQFYNINEDQQMMIKCLYNPYHTFENTNYPGFTINENGNFSKGIMKYKPLLRTVVINNRTFAEMICSLQSDTDVPFMIPMFDGINVYCANEVDELNNGDSAVITHISQCIRLLFEKDSNCQQHIINFQNVADNNHIMKSIGNAATSMWYYVNNQTPPTNIQLVSSFV